MGCYGIGVTRVVAAAIEQEPRRQRGIAWPVHRMAPFTVAIAAVGYDRSSEGQGGSRQTA